MKKKAPNEKPDFSGYVTKTGIRCTDGRRIMPNAFAHNDGTFVPLVWQHLHDDVDNVLGKVLLEHRADGVYGYGYFNDSPKARSAKVRLQHGDIDSMSIFANKLQQRGSDVIHGDILEVSLVLAGANSGAKIDNVCLAHSDGSQEEVEDEVIIHGAGTISLDEEDDEDLDEAINDILDEYDDEDDEDGDDGDDGELAHADGDDETVEDVLNSMTEKQRKVTYALVADAINKTSNKGDSSMKHSYNSFDMGAEDKGTFDGGSGVTLTHSQIKEIFQDAPSYGSLRQSVLAHAATYGIDPIDILYPDAKMVEDPAVIKRDDAWVSSVVNGAKVAPYGRIKSMAFDITADEARARGYVKGNLKKEEVIKALKRTTAPTTIYKKQKIDRDDLVDIEDFDAVAFMKKEMQSMLNEEKGRAILIGDGRDAESPDKINEENIRPIYKEEDMYTIHITLPADATSNDLVRAVVMARKDYRGRGTPTFFTTTGTLSDLLLEVDKIGRRLYQNEGEVASALRCSGITEVPVMENVTRTDDSGKNLELVGIMVNMKDYTIGMPNKGKTSLFDDFDLDYNQYKYLLETRMSGALTQPKSAIIIEREVAEGGAGI